MTETAIKPVTETEEAGRTQTARADVFERDDEYVVQADLPGVQPQDVDIRFEDGELTLHGRRSREANTREAAPWNRDIAGFTRTFRLGEGIAGDRIEADMKHGVLTLRLPKTEAVKPRRIAVRG
jgi:HSP20 family protein